MTDNPLDTPTISFCELVAHPDLYVDKLVRTTATYFVNFESSAFYDSACPSQENFVWPILDCKTRESCKPLRDALANGLTGDPFAGRRAKVVMIGSLKGPKKSGERYGPLEGLRLAFSISKVERSEAFPADSSNIGFVKAPMAENHARKSTVWYSVVGGNLESY